MWCVTQRIRGRGIHSMDIDIEPSKPAMRSYCQTVRECGGALTVTKSTFMALSESHCVVALLASPREALRCVSVGERQYTATPSVTANVAVCQL